MTLTPTFRSHFIDIRGLRYHLNEWGPHDAPLVIGLHGWMDAGATFQFLYDALALPIRFVAIDWRGHGRTQWAQGNVYNVSDYLGDFDFLLDALTSDRPAVIVGHSLGGNVAGLYAGIRPDRVRAIVNVDGFGLWAGDPARAAGYYRGWLDDLHKEGMRRVHPSLDGIVARLSEVSERVTPERARFIAAAWAEGDDATGYRLRADPGLRRRPPTMYRQDETLAIAADIKAAILWAENANPGHKFRFGQGQESVDARRKAIADVTYVPIENTGHMIHWDQPEVLADASRDFLAHHLGLAPNQGENA